MVRPRSCSWSVLPPDAMTPTFLRYGVTRPYCRALETNAMRYSTQEVRLSSFQDQVHQWVIESWEKTQAGRKFGWAELQRLTGASLPALHRIRDGEGEADQATLDKIATGLGVDIPLRETVLHRKRPRNPDARTLIGEAKALLDQAANLLRDPSPETARPERGEAGRPTYAGLLKHKVASVREGDPGQRPPRKRRGKGGES